MHVNPLDFTDEDAFREAVDEADAEFFGRFGSPEAAAVREYASIAGSEHPDRAWILSPYDTWERNPHYQGPPVRHPDDDYDYDEPEVPPQAGRAAYLIADSDDIPF